ncbi:hypothetical protein PM082_024024 [Marasmius tenuissimus]|nr:hypothetical protein PM082_024024 [Marasmius tenuissimus]
MLSGYVNQRNTWVLQVVGLGEAGGRKEGKKRKRTKAKGAGDEAVEKRGAGGVLPRQSLEHCNKMSLAVAGSTKKQDEMNKATKKGKMAKKTEDADDSEPVGICTERNR